MRDNNTKELKRYLNDDFDIIIGQYWNYAIDGSALNDAKKRGSVIFNISMDDMLYDLWSSNCGFVRGASGLGDFVDVTLTTSPVFESYYAHRDMTAKYFPLATSRDQFYEDVNVIRDIDVLFIGNNYGMRSEYINYLIDKGINVEVYGNGWGTKYLNQDEMASYSKRAKIILGFGGVAYSKTIPTMKLRDFDSIMSGALYLTQYNNVLEQHFKENEDIIFFSDKVSCLNKIKYFLNNHIERVDIAQKGQHKCLKHHTWELRFENLFKEFDLK